MITDFIFDGQELSGFGYMICDFDSSSGTETYTVSDISFTNIKSPLSNKSHVIDTSYSDDLTRTIQIMKNTCDNDLLDITNDDLSELSRWLCRKEYKLFKWVEDNDDDEIFYEAKISLNKIELANGRIGVELNITVNAQYGFTKEITNKLSFNSNDTKSITVFSDDEGYIYPNVIIKIKEAGNFKLINTFENRITYIADCKIGEVFTFIGDDMLQVTSNNETHNMSDCYNYKFPRLCTKYNDYTNVFTSNLACDIEFKYRGIRKVGL